MNNDPRDFFTITFEFRLHFRPDFSHCDASVNVNNTLSMRGDQISSVPQFQHPTIWLYFGGVPEDIKQTDSSLVGFAGCMKNLKVKHSCYFFASSTAFVMYYKQYFHFLRFPENL